KTQPPPISLRVPPGFSWYLIKYQVLHVIKLTDQSNLQTYYLKTDAKIAFFAPRGKIFLSKT
ncbi:MAG: hypothetical protein ACOCOP_06580, partial [Prevotella sp.]